VTLLAESIAPREELHQYEAVEKTIAIVGDAQPAEVVARGLAIEVTHA
jgi:hypothetical protein